MAYLDNTGLAYFWGKIKAWANSVFALIGHKHPSSDVNAMTGYSMPASTGAISSGDTLNQAVGKLEKAVVDGDISNVVHRTGDETVQGVKTFKNAHAWETGGNAALSSIQIQSTELERNVAPIGYSRFAGVVILDKNATSDLDFANRLGVLEFQKDVNSDSKLILKTYNPDTVDSETSYFSVGWLNSISYATAPSTSSSRTNGRDVVTRDWIPKDARIVHTTGNETISGNKTFNDRVYIKSQQLAAVYYQYTRFSLPSLPSETIYMGTRIADNSDRVLLDCYHRINSNGDQASVWALHDTKSTNAYKQFVYQYIADGDKFYLAGPADFDYADDSNKIPNTAWLRRATGNFAINAATATKATNDSAGNNISNTYVKKTGDTMSGNLRFAATNAGVTHECLVTMNADSLNFGLYDSTNSHWILISNVDRSWAMFYGDISGNAASATKLATARTIRTNLASTSTASFDGSANITPGVTGTLPVANGGTGLTSLDTFVRTTGDQTINGAKTFSTGITIANNSPTYIIKDTNGDWTGTGPYSAILANDKNNSTCTRIDFSTHNNSGGGVIALRCRKPNSTDFADLSLSLTTGNCWFLPTDNYLYLGGGANRWKQLYASSTTISTSDEREKRDIAPIPDEVLDAWSSVEFEQFRFNDAFAEKGESARTHSGLVAQRIQQAFASLGLDASKYGLFCYDEWDAEEPQYNEKGELERQGREAGNRYALRYEEALCMEAACMRRENARLKKRVADLEERLAALELKIS